MPDNVQCGYAGTGLAVAVECCLDGGVVGVVGGVGLDKAAPTGPQESHVPTGFARGACLAVGGLVGDGEAGPAGGAGGEDARVEEADAFAEDVDFGLQAVAR